MTTNYEAEKYLDLRDLRLLDVLHSTRSVTKTAELLGQTQPRISVWLKRLRDQLNDPLFVRTATGMQPTTRADAAVVKAREILQSMHEIMEHPDFDPFTSTRTFRMCIPDGAQSSLLPSMLSVMRHTAPNVRLEALPLDKDTPHLLENGEADLAFGGFVPLVVTGFYEQTLFDQDYICLVSASHPRIKDTLTLEDFEREAHVAFGYGRSYELIEAEMKARQINRRVMVFLPGVLGVAKIIATTDMITTLPGQIGRLLSNNTPAIHSFPCPVNLDRIVVKQFWHARFHHDPGHQWLRTLCAKQAREGMNALLGEHSDEKLNLGPTQLE